MSTGERTRLCLLCLLNARLNNAAIHTAQQVWERLYVKMIAAKSDVFAKRAMTRSKNEDRRQSREDDARCPRGTSNELFYFSGFSALVFL